MYDKSFALSEGQRDQVMQEISNMSLKELDMLISVNKIKRAKMEEVAASLKVEQSPKYSESEVLIEPQQAAAGFNDQQKTNGQV